jgi:hypothetical protein
MAKVKAPLFSFDARGNLAKLLTFRRRDRQNIAGAQTTHPDAKSPAQLSWRTMYEACSALWHTLSDVEKQAWETNARSKHMTGYALWQSQCLRPNPGIYLPLAGGTMQGDITMASHKITGLPVPTLDPDAATKAYVDSATPPPLQATPLRIPIDADSPLGAVSYIGIGFQPTLLLALGACDQLSALCLGFATGPSANYDLTLSILLDYYGASQIFQEFYDADWNGLYANLQSFDPDGFTLYWEADIPIAHLYSINTLAIA